MKRIFLLACTLSAFLFTWTASAQQLVLGHRGGRREQDENTLSAFTNAVANGIKCFETDVRMSKDGKLVVSHDASLDRMTTESGVIENLSESELRKVVTKKGHPLLFLDDLLSFFKDQQGLYVEFEMKTGDVKAYPDDIIPKYCEKLYESLKASMPKDADWSMTSFDYRPLKYIESHHPEVTTVLITGDPVNSQTVAVAKALGVDRIAANLGGSSRKAVEEAHKAGFKVNLWPGEKVEDTLLALYLGADFCCTDIPIEVKKYIDEHPQTMQVRF